jgi:hypothetical protein
VLPGPGYPPAGRAGLPGWGIALIVADLSATSVALPPAVAGLAEVDDPAIQQQLADLTPSMDNCSCAEQPLVTLYQDEAGTHQVLVRSASSPTPRHPPNNGRSLAACGEASGTLRAP